MSERYRLTSCTASAVVALLITGCSTSQSPGSPDVLYSANASAARALQVPPDLTDVSDSEQFVLPGTTGSGVSRNTLLPTFDRLEFVRESGQFWLSIAEAPEALWPRLLEFLRVNGYTVEQTEPVVGTISTSWQPITDSSDNLLRGLVGGDTDYERIAFRLERGTGETTRLFARRQLAPSAAAADAIGASESWPDSAHNPEQTAALLRRLLVFLGLDRQQAEGLLSETEARSVLTDAEVQVSASGTQLLYHRGYLATLRDVAAALEALDYTVTSHDSGVGRIEAVANDDDGSESPPLVVKIEPLHVSAAVLSLTDKTGAALVPEREKALLAALRERLA